VVNKRDGAARRLGDMGELSRYKIDLRIVVFVRVVTPNEWVNHQHPYVM
jgi:hypothetical protein